MTVSEKVSTMGIRHQVTLPKAIREGVNISEKTRAYIQASEKEDQLVISLQPPAEGVYSKIKISGKGQLVIPKSFRDSKGIQEGTNLVFSLLSGEKIKVQKLLEKRKEREPEWRWSFLVEIIGALEGLAGPEQLEIQDNSLVLKIKEGVQSKEKEIIETVTKIENVTSVRLMVERLQDNKIKFTPIWQEL
ncbi:MAG: AbrB/MazE/SpoVT family DNA-binding domain-containing protein [Candidatus Odinarchaeota archaeon]